MNDLDATSLALDSRPCLSCGGLVSPAARRCAHCHRRPFLDVAVPTREFDTWSFAALLLSILWIAGIGSLLGLIIGYWRLRSIDASSSSRWGRPLAMGGVLAGWIGLALLVVPAMYLGLRLAFRYL